MVFGRSIGGLTVVSFLVYFNLFRDLTKVEEVQLLQVRLSTFPLLPMPTKCTLNYPILGQGFQPITVELL